MMRPLRWLIIGLSTAWQSVNAAVRLVASTSSQSARFMRSISWSRVMPALLTRMSIRPWRATRVRRPAPRAKRRRSSRPSPASARPPAATISSTVRLRVLLARGGHDHGRRAGRGRARSPARCRARRRSRSLLCLQHSCAEHRLHRREPVRGLEIDEGAPLGRSCGPARSAPIPGPTSTNVVAPSADQPLHHVLPADRRRHLTNQRLDRRAAVGLRLARRRWRRPARAAR